MCRVINTPASGKLFNSAMGRTTTQDVLHTSKLSSSEANYEQKSQVLPHSRGTAISNNPIQIIFLLLMAKVTVPT